MARQSPRDFLNLFSPEVLKSPELERAEERASSISLAPGAREHLIWRGLTYQTVNRHRLAGEAADRRVLGPLPPRTERLTDQAGYRPVSIRKQRPHPVQSLQESQGGPLTPP